MVSSKALHTALSFPMGGKEERQTLASWSTHSRGVGGSLGESHRPPPSPHTHVHSHRLGHQVIFMIPGHFQYPINLSHCCKIYRLTSSKWSLEARNESQNENRNIMFLEEKKILLANKLYHIFLTCNLNQILEASYTWGSLEKGQFQGESLGGRAASILDETENRTWGRRAQHSPSEVRELHLWGK